MRKIDPTNVRDDFISAIGDLEAALCAVLQHIDEDGTRKLVAEATLLNAVVMWEGFISDLFVVYLNRDASRYQKQMFSHWKDKVTPLFSVTEKAHPKADAIRQVLDSEGRNLTFRTPEDMVEKAKIWLVAEHAVYFKKLTAQRKAVIAAASATRNYLAHRSSSSKATLQAALENAALPAHLRRQHNEVHDVGKWLLAVPSGTKRRRIESFLKRSKALAKVLSPSS